MSYEQLRERKFREIAERLDSRVPAKVSERIVRSTKRNPFLPHFLNAMGLVPANPDPFWSRFNREQ